MSFPALYLACQAAANLEPLEDEEFGLTWADLDVMPDLDVTWARYRSVGAGTLFGVKAVQQQTVGQWMDAALETTT